MTETTTFLDHPAVRALARTGFAVTGVLHLAIAWLAMRVAFGSGAQTDQSGALAQVADAPAGRVLLWGLAAATGALALWALAQAVLPDAVRDGIKERVSLGATGLVYAALTFTAAKFAVGKASSGSSQESSVDATRTLMEAPAGRWLVALVGLVVVGVGGYFVHKGWTAKFRKRLREHPGRTILALGRVGHVAKGGALVIVGGLFVAAAVHGRAKEAQGLDGALKTLREQPAGQWILAAVAVGLAAYGCYSVARAWYEDLDR